MRGSQQIRHTFCRWACLQFGTTTRLQIWGAFVHRFVEHILILAMWRKHIPLWSWACACHFPFKVLFYLTLKILALEFCNLCWHPTLLGAAVFPYGHIVVGWSAWAWYHMLLHGLQAFYEPGCIHQYHFHFCSVIHDLQRSNVLCEPLNAIFHSSPLCANTWHGGLESEGQAFRVQGKRWVWPPSHES